MENRKLWFTIPVIGAVVVALTLGVLAFSPGSAASTGLSILTDEDNTEEPRLMKRGFGRGGKFGFGTSFDYDAFIAEELGVSVEDIHGIVLGGHGDTMVPLPRHTSVAGIPVTELMSEEKLDAIISRTAKGGGEIVGLLGYSGFYAPAAGVAIMVESILKDKKRVIPCAVYTEGEYGYQDLFIGLPVVLGRGGIERIVPMELNEQERAMLDHSAEAVRNVVKVLGF